MDSNECPVCRAHIEHYFNYCPNCGAYLPAFKLGNARLVYVEEEEKEKGDQEWA